MTDTLTQIVAKVQATLLDDGTKYSSDTITAACRLALKEFNLRAPIYAGTLEDAVSEQLEYVLNRADYAGLISVVDVLWWDSTGDLHVPLLYDKYFEDAVPVIRLRTPRNTGEFLIVRYTIPYTVSGLDSETASTLPAFFDPILLTGVCYWSLLIRATGMVEANNLNPNLTANIEQLKATYRSAFDDALGKLSTQRVPVAEPRTDAWNDSFHGWQIS